MLALDLSPLAADNTSEEPLTWSVVSQQDARSAIVSEGLTVEAVPSAKCLLAFGGYNGKYQNTMQVFKAGQLSNHVCSSHLLIVDGLPHCIIQSWSVSTCV